jgi:hypothetical protein
MLLVVLLVVVVLTVLAVLLAVSLVVLLVCSWWCLWLVVLLEEEGLISIGLRPFKELSTASKSTIIAYNKVKMAATYLQSWNRVLSAHFRSAIGDFVIGPFCTNEPPYHLALPAEHNRPLSSTCKSYLNRRL